MPLRIHVDIGHRPDLDADELLAILRERLGDGLEVYKPGRFQVPDVIVKRSESEGAAVQIVQQRLRKRTRLRVYGLAPSVAQRGFTPVGLERQAEETRALVDLVVETLREEPRLQPARGAD
jgi:hypothetical protein